MNLWEPFTVSVMESEEVGDVHGGGDEVVGGIEKGEESVVGAGKLRGSFFSIFKEERGEVKRKEEEFNSI